MRGLLGVAVAVACLTVCSQAGAQIRGDQSADRWVTIAARECDDYDGHPREPRAQQHHGEPAGPRRGHAVHVGRARSTRARSSRASRAAGRWWAGSSRSGSATRAARSSGPWGSLSIVTDPDGGQRAGHRGDRARARLRRASGQGGVKIEGASRSASTATRSTAPPRTASGSRAARPRTRCSTPTRSSPAATGSARSGARSTTSTATTSRRSSSRPARGTCTATRTTSRRRRRPGRSSSARRSRAPRRARASASAATSPTTRAARSTSPRADGDPGSIEFVRGETRAGDAPWTVVEDAREGWTLTGTCRARRESSSHDDRPGRAQRADQPRRRRHRDLHVHEPADAAGRCAGAAQGDASTARARSRSGSEDEDGDVVARPRADHPLAGRDRRRHACSRSTPAATGSPSGGRSTTRASGGCPASAATARAATAGDPVIVKITAGRGAVCTFTNRLDPAGAINVTRGLDRRARHRRVRHVTGSANPRVQRRQFASTSARAGRRAARGQSTTRAAVRPLRDPAERGRRPRSVTSGALIAVTCNGRLLPFEQGRVRVRITRSTPVQNCTFVNLRQRAPRRRPTRNRPDGRPARHRSRRPRPGPGPRRGDARISRSPSAGALDGRADPDAHVPPARDQPLRVTATRVVVADRLTAGTVLVSARPEPGPLRPRAARGWWSARSATSLRARARPSACASSRSTRAPASTSPSSAPAARRTSCATTSPRRASPRSSARRARARRFAPMARIAC